MKLSKVQIKNFRSIKDVEIDFDPSCRILVGINESGKSNILDALALLSDKHTSVRKDDLREALPNEEGQIDEAYVRFVLKFGKTESDDLFENVSSKILASTKNPEIILIGIKKKSVKEFCTSRNEGLYSADILRGNKSFKYWILPSTYKLITGWKKPTASCPQDFQVELKGEKYQVAQYKLIREADFADIPEGYLEEAKINDLAKLSGSAITTITKERLPEALFWKYDEDNLLPSSVKIDEFSNSPDSCMPLRHMFVLAGIGVDEIKASIEMARKGTDNQFQNYLNRIAKKTTNHFWAVWKEYKNVEFSLKLNADQIIPGVKEKNILDFARRSDGFKRFFTFLLFISINVKTDNLRDSLLLIDEPDQSLHPTGSRYLRDELIRISKKNYVVYSTHSIFMIDPGDVNRHYIVKKKDEITNIEQVQTSNIADEEVIYNALGYSIFSILKENNIIFEGWKDKRLFQVVIKSASTKLKKKYKDIGICHAKGAKSIKTITPMIELAERKCLIISDSDAPAKEQQKLYNKEKGYGEWKNYQDIDSSIEAITGEDFLKNDFITKQVKIVLSNFVIPNFNINILPENKGKLAVIRKWLIKNGMTADQAQDILNQIKDSIFENLKYQNIEDTYIKLLKRISF